MEDHYGPQTCLSASPHDQDIRDNLLHYFGCLGMDKRQRFFRGLPETEQEYIIKEERRTKQLRSKLESHETAKVLISEISKLLQDFRGSRSGGFDLRQEFDQDPPAEGSFASSQEFPGDTPKKPKLAVTAAATPCVEPDTILEEVTGQATNPRYDTGYGFEASAIYCSTLNLTKTQVSREYFYTRECPSMICYISRGRHGSDKMRYMLNPYPYPQSLMVTDRIADTILKLRIELKIGYALNPRISADIRK